MDATTASERARRAIDAIGAARFGPQPELKELTDLHWSLVYLVGRTCVLGAGPRTAAAVMGYFPPAVLDLAYGAVDQSLGRDAFREGYIDAGDRIGDRLYGDLDGGEELATSLERLVDETSPVGRPLAMAWADLPRPSGVGARIERAGLVLRELRGDDHLHVVAAHGLLGPEALLLKGVWDGRDDPEDTARTFGWRDEADREHAWQRLVAAGRITEDRQLTDEGRAERDAMETLTAAMASQPWTALTDDERARTVELLETAVPEA